MRASWLVPALALVLTGCSAEPRDELRADVEAVTLAANDGSAQGVRDAVDDLLSTVRAQVASQELSREEGQRLTALGQRIAAQAGVLDPVAPSPEPTVEEEPSPEETEEEEPSPEPSPEPTEEPSPEPEPEPEPTEEEPEPGQTFSIVPFPQESPAAEQASGSGSGGQASPAASPAA